MLRVRLADVGDAAAVAEVYRPYVESSVASFESDPPSADEVRRRMLVEPRLPWLLACRADEVVGYAYASPHHDRPGYRWAVNVSVYLRADAQGQGAARRLYGELLPLVTGLGYVTAIAGITLPNPASVGLHESMGFTQVGRLQQVGFKHGRWYDVGWWQRELAEGRDPDPAEPRAWPPATC